MDYMRDIEINELNLNQEFIKQAALVLSYGEQLAEVEQKVSDLKDEYSYMKECFISIKASIEIDIRSGKVPVNIPKLTEDAIKSYINTNKIVTEYIKTLFEQKKEINETVKNRDCLQAMYDALKHKKDCLLELSRRQTAGFYATPDEAQYNKRILDKLNKRGD